MDKGYQGAADVMRAVVPRKKPLRSVMLLEDVRFNRKLSSDRIIVENYFGRLSQLWAILSRKWVRSEKLYDLIFGLGIAFTNYHVTLHSLKDVDGEWFTRHRNRLISIGATNKRKRAEAQSKYRKKRKLRLEIGYRGYNGESEDETQEIK